MHHVTIKSRVINSIAIVLRILKKTKTKIKKCVGGKLLTKSFQETSIGVNQTQKTLHVYIVQICVPQPQKRKPMHKPHVLYFGEKTPF